MNRKVGVCNKISSSALTQLLHLLAQLGGAAVAGARARRPRHDGLGRLLGEARLVLQHRLLVTENDGL